jgi:hypothetical protein
METDSEYTYEEVYETDEEELPQLVKKEEPVKKVEPPQLVKKATVSKKPEIVKKQEAPKKKVEVEPIKKVEPPKKAILKKNEKVPEPEYEYYSSYYSDSDETRASENDKIFDELIKKTVVKNVPEKSTTKETQASGITPNPLYKKKQEETQEPNPLYKKKQEETQEPKLHQKPDNGESDYYSDDYYSDEYYSTDDEDYKLRVRNLQKHMENLKNQDYETLRDIYNKCLMIRSVANMSNIQKEYLDKVKLEMERKKDDSHKKSTRHKK